MEATRRLGLPFIIDGQAMKHITHNAALDALDTLVQSTVTGEVGVLPAQADTGTHYLLDATADTPGHLAVFTGTGWKTYPPQEGWRIWDAGAGNMKIFSQGQWRPLANDSFESLGINADADDTNRLSVNAEATLLNHAGTDHQLKINKAALRDTASLLFQTAFAGKAEMGLAGDDNFTLKVPADGAWPAALRIDTVTATVDVPTSLTVQGSPVVRQADPDIARHRANLSANADLNTVQTTGHYLQKFNSGASNGINYPSDRAGILEVVAIEGRVVQTYTDYRGLNRFFRTFYKGDWSDWAELSQI